MNIKQLTSSSLGKLILSSIVFVLLTIVATHKAPQAQAWMMQRTIIIKSTPVIAIASPIVQRIPCTIWGCCWQNCCHRDCDDRRGLCCRHRCPGPKPM